MCIACGNIYNFNLITAYMIIDDLFTIDFAKTDQSSAIVDLIYSFQESRNSLDVPDMTENSFSKKLYAAYLSYLPKDQFSYPLKMNKDERGSLIGRPWAML